MQSQNTQLYKPTYLNVMEIFVAQEVERQLEQLPNLVRQHIKPEEVVANALTKLPKLYTQMEKGWQYQYQLAKQYLQIKIAEAVRQALVTARYDVFTQLSDSEKRLYLKDWQESTAKSWGTGSVMLMM